MLSRRAHEAGLVAGLSVCLAAAVALLTAGLALGQSSAPATSTAGSAATAASTDPNSQAFSDQSDAEALTTVREQFPWLLDAPALKWPAPGFEQKVKGYLDDETALVGEKSGRRGLVESSLPLRGETPDGATAPIDLGLVDADGSSFTPKSAAADVRIPDNAEGELRFPDQSFGVSLAGADSQPAAVRSNKAFYANVVPDGDLVLEPQPQGAELSVVLRSPDAPAAIPLSFNLAADQRLRLATPSGDEALPPGSVELVEGERRVAAVYPAAAVDADGQPVPVSYRLDGDRIVMEVDTSRDLAWPVLVDPPIGVYDNNGNSTGPGTTGYTWPNWTPESYPTTNWSYCNNQGANPSKKFYFCQGNLSGASWTGGPLFVKANATQTYTLNSDYAQWVKQAPTDAYIYRLDAADLYNVGPHQARLVVGVRKADGSDWEPGGVLWGNGTTTTTGDLPSNALAAYKTPRDFAIAGATRYLFVHAPDLQTVGPTPTNPITPGNRAVLRLLMESGAPGAPLPYVQMGGAATFSSETFAPSFDVPIHTRAVPSGGGWVEAYSDTVTLTARDRGLGMGRLALAGPGIPATTSASSCAPNGGPGGASNLYDGCARTLSLSKSYTAPEGVNTYSATALDLVGNQDHNKDQTWTVKVDSSPPSSVSIGGDLAADANKVVGRTSFGLNVSASDAHSGVSNVSFALSRATDPTTLQQGASSNPSCVASGCPQGYAADFSIDTTSLADGTYTIAAKGTDQLGHSRTTTLTFLVDQNVLTPSQAVARITDARPDVVADSVSAEAPGEVLDPTLTSASTGDLEAAGTLRDTAIENQYAGGFDVGNEGAVVSVAPAAVGADAMTAAITNGDAAVYANTQYATDAVVRPAGNGVETVLQLRSGSAPETLSWNVGLEQGQSLATQPSGDVIVVDPAPPVQSQTIQAYPPPAPSPDDVYEAPTVAEVDDPYSDAPLPPDDGIEPVEEHPPVTVEEADPGVPRLSLPGATSAANNTAGQVNRETDAAADAQDALDQGSAQAVFLRPTARDATGVAVPVTMTTSGSTVSLAVRHRWGSYAYPITVTSEISAAGDDGGEAAAVRASSAGTIEVMTWNIHGAHLSDYDLRQIAAFIARPTNRPPVVLLQEVCYAQHIALKTLLKSKGFAMDVAFAAERGLRECPHQGQEGNAILARRDLKFHDYGTHEFPALPDPATDRPERFHRVVLGGTVKIAADFLHAYSNHLSVRSATKRHEQIRELGQIARHWANAEFPRVLVGGDFNQQDHTEALNAAFAHHDPVFSYAGPHCPDHFEGTVRNTTWCFDHLYREQAAIESISSAIIKGDTDPRVTLSDHYPVKFHVRYK